MGFTATEEARLKSYLGLAKFELKSLGHGVLNQPEYWGESNKHLLVLARTSYGLIGGYTGENYFGRTASGTYTPAIGGEFIFNATVGIKQLADYRPIYAMKSSLNVPAYFSGDFSIGLDSRVYCDWNAYGLNQSKTILNLAAGIGKYTTTTKIAYYIVTPK